MKYLICFVLARIMRDGEKSEFRGPTPADLFTIGGVGIKILDEDK